MVVQTQREAVQNEQKKTVDRITALERSYVDIVNAADLTSTDDEHDPEGATIGY